MNEVSLKRRNLVELILQSVFMVLLFVPGMYTRIACEAGYTYHDPSSFAYQYGIYRSEVYTLKDRGLTSFFEKFLGSWIFGAIIFAVATVGIIFFVLQFLGEGKRRNWGLTIIAPIIELLLLVAYTFVFDKDSIASYAMENHMDYNSFEPAFLLYIVFALLIALISITWIGYSQVKKKGILIASQPTDQEKVNNASAYSNSLEELATLKKLLDDGVITEEEFDMKKKQLLGI